MTETEVFEQYAPFIRAFIYRAQWQALRPVQIAAGQAIFGSTADVLIATGTASGKTEAAFLPILSQLHAHPAPSVQALYLGPLKALINDQFRRLESLCDEGNIPVHRWHGDVSPTEKAKLLKAPRGVLQITPESLESLFINRTRHLRALFAHLQFVVIDETHTFLNSDRGIQLATQLARLTPYCVNGRPRRIGLSATIGDMAQACAWLNPPAPDTVQVVAPTGVNSPVKFHLLHETTNSRGLPAAFVQDMYQLTRNCRALIFCNDRTSVEQLTKDLNAHCQRERIAERYWPHHGSISKEVRETAEQRMKDEQCPTSVVCTNTLELGIDIGQLDLVVQLNSTFTVSAFAQRLGRSGRRAESARIMQMYSTVLAPQPNALFFEALPFALLQALAVVELFSERWVEPPNISRLAYNVLYQQILALLAERNGLRPAELVGILAQAGSFPAVTATDYETLLRHLHATEQIQQLASGELIPGLQGERVLRSREFYAAFQAPRDWEVRHGTQLLGTIAPPSINLQVGDYLLLSGKVWSVQEIVPSLKLYLVMPAPNAEQTHFSSTGVPDIHPLVARRMRALLGRDDIPPYLCPAGVASLQSARGLARASALLQKLAFLTPAGMVLLPWTGTRAQAALRKMFAAIGHPPSPPHPWAICLPTILSHGQLLAITKQLLAQPFTAETLIEEPQTTRKFDEFVPAALLRQREIREQLDLATAQTILAELLANQES